MSYVIRITSDIGELRIWLVTVFLVKPMNDELLGRVKSLVSECLVP
ncbi:hypothetical protein [Vulcanisaeta sp. JCM 16159]|nr:hypothetical protein [Vulcanisaeta sp. JCM 16159]